MKSKAISDKGAFAVEAATSSNGIQRLSSLVLQLPNNATNPAFLLLSSVMACTLTCRRNGDGGACSSRSRSAGERRRGGLCKQTHGTQLRRVPSETALRHLTTVKDAFTGSCLLC